MSSAPTQHAGMRARNLARVLGEVARSGPITRARVAAATGLTKSSVSGLAADLLAAGLVSEGDAVTPRRGRPAGALEVASGTVAGLGFEVNVDYLAAMVLDLAGTPRYRHVAQRDHRGRPAADVLADLGTIADAAVRAAHEQGLALAGACLAVPGVVREDVIVRAPNLEWRDVEVAGRLPGPVELGNEADLAALGEFWFGGHRGGTDAGPLRDFVQVSGEVGIGGGIVVAGELFVGAHGRAGELGHVVVDPDGPACSCGGHGCLERVAGQQAILTAAGLDSVADLVDACERDDPAALAAVRAAGRWVGIALASVTNLLDPDAVVLGGIFARLAPWLVPAVDAALAEHTGSAGTPRLLVSGLGSDAAVRGAAGRVVHRVLADPAGYLATTRD